METEKQETIFADGVFFNKPHENAPDFVKGSVSFADVAKAIEFLKKHQQQNKLNLDLLKSREGKLYFKLNTFVPKKKEDDIKEDEVPW